LFYCLQPCLILTTETAEWFNGLTSVLLFSLLQVFNALLYINIKKEKFISINLEKEKLLNKNQYHFAKEQGRSDKGKGALV
jgi:hypothetical protein